MNNYQETLDYLYARLPMFQRDGAASSIKKDLSNTRVLCRALGHPEQKFSTVHVAGTNGKGSSSHMLAAILQAQGYKTGLYTSPHLKDFTERIRINGKSILPEEVIGFTARIKPVIESVKPSFFEVTVAMAFDYFAKNKVEIAVIETGLGGRLDSTNVIQPLLSLITNIGWDHMDLLGDTLAKIAAEKAGVIKYKTPVVIGETQEEVAEVFKGVAKQQEAALFFAEDQFKVVLHRNSTETVDVLKNDHPWFTGLHPALKGAHQRRNIVGVLSALEHLPFHVSRKAIELGIERVNQLTSLKGRYQTLAASPKVVADVAHNVDGVKILLATVAQESFRKLHLILGMVKGKDHDKVLQLLPKEAAYYFTQPQQPRALPTEELLKKAIDVGLEGKAFFHVEAALSAARAAAGPEDLIVVFGSNFVVAELAEL